MDVVFALEPLTPELGQESMPLIEAHWREIAHDLTIPLSPDWERYYALQDAGSIRVYTARRNGEIIGYAWFIVNRNLHYSTSVQAIQDVIFIRKDLRRGTLGTRLIKFSEEQLKQEGVQVVVHHIKAKHDWSPLIERLGYSLVDLIYLKRIN
jgi:GNAT superfamily N-acetyltransferase